MPASFDCRPAVAAAQAPTVSRGGEQPLESQKVPLAAQAASVVLTVSAEGLGEGGGVGDVVGGRLLGHQGH